MKKRKLLLGLVVALTFGVSYNINYNNKLDFPQQIKNLTPNTEVYKSIRFGSSYNSTGVQTYTNSWSATKDEFTVDVENWNNNNNGWDLIKAGPKNAKSVSTATITTSSSIDKPITDVVLKIASVNTSHITSLNLYCATNNTFTQNLQTISKDPATLTSGDLEFTIETPSENNYYKLEVGLKNTSGTNGTFQVSGLDFYKAIETVEGESAITYVLNGGTNDANNPNVYTEGTGATINAPTKRGYNFLGWYLNDDTSNFVTSIPQDQTGDVTLTANWEKVDVAEDYLTGAMDDSTDYRIIGKILVKKNDGEVYIYNGTNNMKLYGSGNFSGLNVGDVIDVYGTYDESNEQLQNFAYVDKINEEVTTPTPLTSVNDINDQHLYEYVSLSYLQLNANLSNSTAIKGQDFILYYSNNSNVSGYKANTYFANSYVNVTGVILPYNSGIEIMISFIELSTLTTVTFETFGGTAIDSVEIVPGSIITRPSTTPTKESDVYWVYTFENWYDDSNCNEDNFTGDPFNFNTPITENTTLYARYTKEANTAAIDMISTFETKRSLTYKYDYTVTGTEDGNIDFNASEQGYSNGESITSIQFAHGLTASLDIGTNKNNNPKFYTSDNTLRLYSGNTITISNSNGNISSIEFNSTGSWSASVGELSNGTWTGEASTIVFTNTANAKITSLSIEYEKETKDFSFYNTAIRFGGKISKDYWTAINTQGVVTDYGIMLSSKNNLDDLGVETIKDAFEADPSNVTIRSNGNANTPEALDEDYYLFNAKITFSNESLFEKDFHAVAYMVVNGEYKFFAESHCSVKSLAQEYLNDNTLNYDEGSFDGSLAALAAYGE